MSSIPWPGQSASNAQWPYPNGLGSGQPASWAPPPSNSSLTQHNPAPGVNYPPQNWSCPPPPQAPLGQSYTPTIPPPSQLPHAPPGPPPVHLPPPPRGPPPGQFIPQQNGPPPGPPPSYGGPQGHFTGPVGLPPSPVITPTVPPPPYPSPGPPPAPPSCPPPNQPYPPVSTGYKWGPMPPQPQQFPPPANDPPWSEWNDRTNSYWSTSDDHSRHGSRPREDRGCSSTSSGTFRDSRGKERESASLHQENLHSTRYDGNRGSPRYKDEHRYSSKYLDDRRLERRSSARKRTTRSPDDLPPRSEGRSFSPSHRPSKDLHKRYEKERPPLDSRYKDDRSYPVKTGDSGWRERTGGQPNTLSRSPQDQRRRETRQPSSPHRMSSEQTLRSGKSPSRRLTSGSQTSSPERKRFRLSRNPGKVQSRTSNQGKASGARKGATTRGESTTDHDPVQLTVTREEEGEEEQEEEEGEGEEEDDNSNKEKEETKEAVWVRSAPADLYYQRDEKNPLVLQATKKLKQLCETFDEKLIKRVAKIREEKKKKRKEMDQKAGQKTSGARNGCCGTAKKKSEKETTGKEDNEPEQKTNSEESGNNNNDKNNTEKPTEEPNQPSPEKTVGTEIKTPADTVDKEEGEGAEGECDQQPKAPVEDTCDESQTSKDVCKLKHNSKKGSKKCGGSRSNSSSDNSDNNNSDSDSSSSSEDEESEMDRISKELEKKRNHPDRLHPELWFNDPGEMNDGPLCRCSLKAQRSGIRHGYYVGENHLESCDPWTNNADRLHHYLITISPPTNFLIKTPTVISHDGHEFIFEGFSLLSHHPLEEVPTCRVIRFNIEYTILYIDEKIPDNFCIHELDLFYWYLFVEVLELVDLNLHAMGDANGCPRFHFMPRFVRKLADNGKEILSMNEVLRFLMRNSGPLVQPEDLAQLLNMSQHQWQNYADQLKGMIVSCPGMKPCSIRVDQLDRDQVSEETINYPVIVHFGIRPPQLSYAGNPEYQKAWREYVKFRHLLANMPKPSFEDKRRLEGKENKLQEMRMTSKMKRDVTIAVSSQGFYRTGIMCDVVQHAMLLPVLVCHLRFHQSLEVLERRINYSFNTRFLLQLALTHPSYRENFGTNPDHARNSLTNCGIRQPEYGDRRIHYMNTRKRGINTLINIMSRFGRNLETESKITHNERLEFLGDAVVEFLTSIHLFHLFPSLEEGGLATYRAAIVQNQHLAVLAEKLGLDQFMLYAHGSDLCHDFELRHAMANCFEALMGAIFLDSSIEAADKVLSSTLFLNETILHGIWAHYPPHPIQEQEPHGDRKWIKDFPILTKLSKFEESIGIEFQHIRLLARAFTDRSIGFNNLTLGSNQRLEFLGDTVLQLVSSEYLYKFFPEHHEGHLSLLRSSLVNNRTQAVVCDDLGMTSYAMYSHLKTELKTKDRADLLEAFLGALYIDRGLDYCRKFCHVCFFPRLHQFIMNQDWNDPKSKLQQCCLTLRTMDGGEPDIPIYKVIECKGPTNTRVYSVAVYFRARRLAKASGHSIQQAEMNAAREALLNSKELFPQLDHQRRVIEKSVKIQGVKSDPPHRVRERERERNGQGVHREDDRRNRPRNNRDDRQLDNRRFVSRGEDLHGGRENSRTKENLESRNESEKCRGDERRQVEQERDRANENLEGRKEPERSRGEEVRRVERERDRQDIEEGGPSRIKRDTAPYRDKDKLNTDRDRATEERPRMDDFRKPRDDREGRKYRGEEERRTRGEERDGRRYEGDERRNREDMEERRYRGEMEERRFYREGEERGQRGDVEDKRYMGDDNRPRGDNGTKRRFRDDEDKRYLPRTSGDRGGEGGRRHGEDAQRYGGRDTADERRYNAREAADRRGALEVVHNRSQICGPKYRETGDPEHYRKGGY